MFSYVIRTYLIVAIGIVDLTTSTDYVKVCAGTTNSLGYSHRGYDSIYRNMFANCTHVDGNLELVYTPDVNSDPGASHVYDLSFLASIREVSGYVLLSGLHSETVPLTDLRVIRGQTLYSPDGATAKFGLYVAGNCQPSATGVGVKEIHLPSLREVLRGSVMFADNYELCFVDTVDWTGIVTDKSAGVSVNWTMPSRQRRVCGNCDAACGTLGCWSQRAEMCRKPSVRCATQCDGSCYGSSARDCCHHACVGGCVGPTRADCTACRNFLSDGSCTESCPPPFIFDPKTRQQVRNPDVRYSLSTVCVERCPEYMMVDAGACVSSCGEGRFAAESGECAPCDGGVCPKQCSVADRFISGRNVDDFVGCTVLTGTVRITNETFTTVPAIGVDRLSVFQNVEEITEALIVEADRPGFSDLSFFRKLRVIRGRQLVNGVGLRIVRTSLRMLGLRSLQSVANGRVFIGFNPHLCYADTINWTAIAPSGAKVMTNGSVAVCGRCSARCSPAGCWGPGSDDCLSCAAFSRGGHCVDSCDLSDGFFVVAGTQECQACNEECLNTCMGPGTDECDACRHVQDGPYCRAACSEMHYADADGQCQTCSPTCIQNCTGPLGNLGPGGCSACDVVVYDSKSRNPSYCLPPNSDCPDRFYSKIVKDAATHRRYVTCRPCYHLCSVCFDSTPNACDRCDGLWQEDDCVLACSEQYYEEPAASPATDRRCKPCDEMCSACRGPSFGDCTLCSFVTVFSDPERRDENAPFNCTESCPEWAPRQLKQNANGHTITVCVTDAHYDAETRSNRAKIAGAVVGGVLGATVLIGLVAVVVFYLKRGMERAHRNKDHLQKRIAGVDEIVPLNVTTAQPDMSQLRIIKESELRRADVIGSGAFGTVYKGVWAPEGENVKIPVAVKVLREDSSSAQSVELLDEARIMASVIHPNCVRVVGVCMTARMMLVMPLLPLGCILEYVKKYRAAIGSASLLNWCAQIARGMEYLEQRGIVHCDLAARNVLMKNRYLVKITDFGLSKMLDFEQELLTVTGGRMAVKWLALESVQHRVFTSKSDVWSYGVTVWELTSFGQRPYEGVRAIDILYHLEDGNRLPQPEICTMDVYKIMFSCWTVDAGNRPTFKQLNETFTEMARDPSRYLIIEGDGAKRLPEENAADEEQSVLSAGIDDGSGVLVTADDYLQPKRWNTGNDYHA